jgi:hypothetical protein
MTNLQEKIAAELKVRELLEREGIPPADRVEYGHSCIRLFWDAQKVALVVDIDEFAHTDEDLLGLDAFPR